MTKHAQTCTTEALAVNREPVMNNARETVSMAVAAALAMGLLNPVHALGSAERQ